VSFIDTDDSNHPFSADYFTVITHFFYGSSDFHLLISLLKTLQKAAGDAQANGSNPTTGEINHQIVQEISRIHSIFLRIGM